METNQKYLIAGIVLIIAVAAWFQFENKAAINNFDECVKAGNPVMDTYPRECKTSDGRSYAEDLSGGCVENAQCPNGSFCGMGECKAFMPETVCSIDSDCILINRQLLFSCCYSGSCDPVDYSQPGWIAVSSNWFNAGRASACPAQKDCGPEPLCPVNVIDKEFRASCWRGTCQKIAKGASGCQDLCGDGICQETACQMIGCPCTETKITCPLDCNATGGNKTPATNHEKKAIDYSCASDADCSIKNVGSTCGEYFICVNKDFEPVPPELELSECGPARMDGCACQNSVCVGTIDGRPDIN